MANILVFTVCADVPFDWVSELSPEDAKLIANLVLSPSGAELRYEDRDWMVPNDKGGDTCMHRMWVEGREALRWRTLAHVCEAIAGVGKLHVALGKDVQFSLDHPWWPLVSEELLSGEAENDEPPPITGPSLSESLNLDPEKATLNPDGGVTLHINKIATSCTRCTQPIPPGEAVQIYQDLGSVGGCWVEVHEECRREGDVVKSA
jgi:hypothetical protein